MCFDYEIEKKGKIKRNVAINENTEICSESEKIKEHTTRQQRIIDNQMATSSI